MCNYSSIIKKTGVYMTQNDAIRRYALILKKIRESNFPDFSEIKDYLVKNGIAKNDRTIQRDFEQIRDQFGINIIFSRQKHGYYISETEIVTFDPLLRFLEHLTASDLILESLTKSRKLLSRISFDDGAAKGYENYVPIVNALRERKIVTFTYATSFNNEKKEYTVFPYLLKEYMGQWYLVGSFSNGEKLYVFGLDRISELKIENKTFVYVSSIDPREKFKDTIGLSVEGHKKEKIILSFDPEQAGYIKSLPLHRSQSFVLEDKNEYRIELNVIPNYELKQKILMHGSKVKVLSPAWLADEIKNDLAAALENYK
jgi:predicted DNA-binding transcriptional regulator YafY